MKEDHHMKNFSYVAINRVLTTTLYGIFWIVIAFLLTPEHYGELSYLVSIAGIFSLVSKFGSHYSIIIFKGEKHYGISDRINFLVVLTTIPTAMVLLTVNAFASLACIGFSFFAMNQNNLLAAKNYKTFMWNGLMKSILLLSVPVSLYFVLGVPGIIFGIAISDLVSSIQYIKSLRIERPMFFGLKENYKVLIHNFALDLSMNLPRVADKLLIVPLFGFVFAGIYQFNFQILSALETLPIALHTYLLPEESSGQTHKKITYLVIIGAVVLTFTVIILGPIVINQFFPKYNEGILSLQILISTLIPLSLSSVFAAKLQARKSTIMGYSFAIRLISLLGLIALLGKWYGLIGLSMAVLISTSLYAIFLLIIYKLNYLSSKK